MKKSLLMPQLTSLIQEWRNQTSSDSGPPLHSESNSSPTSSSANCKPPSKNLSFMLDGLDISLDTMEGPTKGDPFDLSRFIEAQAPIYADVLQELTDGRKRTHWMWFVFPQFDGLGFSETTIRYSIKSLAEARAYLEHPVLGERLFKCAQLVLDQETKTTLEIFGSPDNMKLQSSMTLFAAVGQANSVFAAVLDKYFDGQRDLKTLNLIRAN